MRAKILKDPLTRFYQDLLSKEWHRRLRAYDIIEEDLRQRGGYVLPEGYWGDMKLLAGQIISIYFKRHVPHGLEEFKEMLKALYLRLMSPLYTDKSPGHEASQELLVDIYDDDDYAARREIHRFFQSPNTQEDRPVLENLWRCYAFMMQEVKERARAF